MKDVREWSESSLKRSLNQVLEKGGSQSAEYGAVKKASQAQKRESTKPGVRKNSKK